MEIVNKKILAIIPARGGSKTIPKKNIKSLADRPLIAYTIEAAERSKYIDRFVVSTDDNEISEVAKKLGAEVINRPPELAKDDSPTVLALVHALVSLEEAANYKPDLVCLLQPTSPLRTAEHIDECVEKFLSGDYDSMTSVKFIYEPRFEMDAEDRLVPAFKSRLPRQQREPSIIENGAIYLTEVELIKQNTITGERIGYYRMDEFSSLDIDDKHDFKVAELLILND